MVTFEVSINDKLVTVAGEPTVTILSAFIRSDRPNSKGEINGPAQLFSMSGSRFKEEAQHHFVWANESNGSLKIGDEIRVRFIANSEAHQPLMRMTRRAPRPSLRAFNKLKKRYFALEQQMADGIVLPPACELDEPIKPFVAFETFVNGKLRTVAGNAALHSLVAIITYLKPIGDLSRAPEFLREDYFSLDLVGFGKDRNFSHQIYWTPPKHKAPKLKAGDEITIRIIEATQARRCVRRYKSSHLDDLQSEYDEVKNEYLAARKIYEPDAV
ncbi:MAG: hypothetical protein HOP19_02575 [Acidobacteria bacterium]|nr:hypothetical protein [Acidobacteriota bacterium]